MTDDRLLYISETVGRVEGKCDLILDKLENQEKRIRSLERTRTKALAMIAMITTPLTFFLSFFRKNE